MPIFILGDGHTLIIYTQTINMINILLRLHQMYYKEKKALLNLLPENNG